MSDQQPAVTSNTLPQQALDYLNTIAANKTREANEKGSEAAKSELLSWAWNWFGTARTWRKASYEDDWLTFQRNADGRFDPKLAAKFKDWQSKAFVDLTPTHRENIQAELFRLRSGSKPIVEIKNRPGGTKEQAENIRDIIAREFEKSGFETEDNKVCEDKTTYGSGLSQIWYEVRTEDRPIRVPITETPSPLNPASLIRHIQGKPKIIGYKQQNQLAVIYRGVKIKHINIWDFFWDPKALEIKGHTVLVRGWIGLQEILDKIKSGDFLPSSGQLMQEQASNENVPADKSLLYAERGIAAQVPKREGNQKTWEYYRLYGRLPQKWVYPLLKQPLMVDDAEKLVPAIVTFSQYAIFSVELNPNYDGEPPIKKDDYLPVAMRFIGRGICEMLRNNQMVINAVVNQRLDEGNLALQEGYAVNQKALVNPDDLIEGGPGLVVRLNEKNLGPNGDVRNAIFPLGRPDVKINAGFTEVHEWERLAQDRTSANKVQLAENSRYQGAQKTLGGMQMLKNMAGEKFAFIEMLSEAGYLADVARAVWALFYSNASQEDIVAAIGVQRAQNFQMMSPEQVETAYQYSPQGVFERSAKAERQARLAALREGYGGAPWFDQLATFKEEAKSFDVTPEDLIVPQAEAHEIMAKAQQMALPMAKQLMSQIIQTQAEKDFLRNIADNLADREADKIEKGGKDAPTPAGPETKTKAPNVPV